MHLSGEPNYKPENDEQFTTTKNIAIKTHSLKYKFYVFFFYYYYFRTRAYKLLFNPIL